MLGHKRSNHEWFGWISSLIHLFVLGGVTGRGREEFGPFNNKISSVILVSDCHKIPRI